MTDERKKDSGSPQQRVGSDYARDTLPPSPEKARIISTEISGEWDLNALRKEIAGSDEAPSIPPPSNVDVDFDKLEEGEHYRLMPNDIRPSQLPPEEFDVNARTDPPPAPPAEDATASQMAWQTALEVRENKLRDLDATLGEREERILEREMVVGSREKLVADREEKLKQREVRLRDWEARLMDMQAEIRESSPPPKTEQKESELEPAPEPIPEPPPRTSSFKIEITSGDSGWSMVDDAEEES